MSSFIVWRANCLQVSSPSKLSSRERARKGERKRETERERETCVSLSWDKSANIPWGMGGCTYATHATRPRRFDDACNKLCEQIRRAARRRPAAPLNLITNYRNYRGEPVADRRLSFGNDRTVRRAVRETARRPAVPLVPPLAAPPSDPPCSDAIVLCKTNATMGRRTPSARDKSINLSFDD